MSDSTDCKTCFTRTSRDGHDRPHKTAHRRRRGQGRLENPEHNARAGRGRHGSVPDLAVLCRLYLDFAGNPAQQVQITHMIYGGHVNEFDVHHFGYNYTLITAMLAQAGFRRVEQVDLLHEFQDTSHGLYDGVLISLNFIATK